MILVIILSKAMSAIRSNLFVTVEMVKQELTAMNKKSSQFAMELMVAPMEVSADQDLCKRCLLAMAPMDQTVIMVATHLEMVELNLNLNAMVPIKIGAKMMDLLPKRKKCQHALAKMDLTV